MFDLSEVMPGKLGTESATVGDVVLVGDMGVGEAMAEVIAAESEVQKVEVMGSILEERAVALESLIGVAEASEEGMDRQSAAMFHVAVEAAVTGTGIEKEILSALPAVESWGAGSAQTRATKLATEAAGEALKTFWAAIVNAIKSARESMRKMMLKMFGAAKKVEARAKALGEKAQNTSGAAENKKIDISTGNFGQLHIGGSISDVKAGVESIQSQADFVLNTISKHNSDIAEQLTDGMGSFDAESSDFAKDFYDKITAKAPAEGIFTKSDTDYPGIVRLAKSGYEAKSSVELPGGQALVLVKKIAAGNDGKDLVLSTTYRVASVAVKAVEAKEVSIDVLTPAGVTDVTAIIEDLASDIYRFEKDNKKLDDKASKLIKEIEKMKTDAKEDALKFAKKIGSYAKDVGQRIDQPMSSWISHALKSSNAALNVCQQSLAQYK